MQKCDYNYLGSEMNAFIMGENRELLIKYMRNEKSKSRKSKVIYIPK